MGQGGDRVKGITMTHKKSRLMDLDRFNRRWRRCTNDSERYRLLFEIGPKVGDAKVQRAVKYRFDTMIRQQVNAGLENAARGYRCTHGIVLQVETIPAPMPFGVVHKHKTNGGPFPSVYSTTKADKAYCRSIRPYVPAPPLEDTPYTV